MTLAGCQSDVIRLIFLYEKIQTTVLDGASLSTDEANIIRQCATGLLTTVPHSVLQAS